jgi:hypothetical protein
LTQSARASTLLVMMTVERRVGRLCEARFVSPVTVAETHMLAERVRQIVGSASSALIFCCDARQLLLFPPEVSDLLTTLMRADNPRVERNGLVASATSVFMLQIERMFREAGNPGRRAFRERAALEAWLAQVLTVAERERMRAFLDEGGPSQAK